MKRKVLALFCAMVLLLSACGAGGHKGSQQPKETPVAETTQTPDPTPTPEPTPTPAPEEILLAVGDSAALKDWGIVVSDFYFAKQIDYGDFFYYSPEDGCRYAVVSAQITNNGKESQTFLPSFSTNSDVRADIYYAGEYEYSATVLLMDEDLHNTTLNPLTSKSGIIVFELPEMIETSEEDLILTFSAGWDEVSISLR